MACYDHLCENCGNEFELEYSVHKDPPTICILCNFEGKVKRLISFATPGTVELTGNDLKDKIKLDGQKLQAEACRNENVLSNLIGENKYQSNVKQLEKDLSNYRPKIRNRK